MCFVEAPSTIIRTVAARPRVGVVEIVGASEIVVERTREVVSIEIKPFSFIWEMGACTLFCCH